MFVSSSALFPLCLLFSPSCFPRCLILLCVVVNSCSSYEVISHMVSVYFAGNGNCSLPKKTPLRQLPSFTLSPSFPLRIFSLQFPSFYRCSLLLSPPSSLLLCPPSSSLSPHLLLCFFPSLMRFIFSSKCLEMTKCLGPSQLINQTDSGVAFLPFFRHFKKPTELH